MAIQTIPGLTGFTYARVASMDKRAVGKLTDANHLESFHSTEPADYDKKIISLYTQSSLYSNDFLDMINKSLLITSTITAMHGSGKFRFLTNSLKSLTFQLLQQLWTSLVLMVKSSLSSWTLMNSLRMQSFL